MKRGINRDIKGHEKGHQDLQSHITVFFLSVASVELFVQD